MMREICIPWLDGHSSGEPASPWNGILNPAGYFPPVRELRFTAGKYLRRLVYLMRCILRIWKTSMWDTGQESKDIIMNIVQKHWFIISEVRPADPDTMNSR